jgi:phage tail sheath protein FI
MAEILSPGVFIEEVPSAVQVVQPVSTSNMGIVGATKRGPTDEATLITSFAQFTRIFGELISDSRTGLSMAAYFANGGRRAYVVRVMPSDAVEAGTDQSGAPSAYDKGQVTSGRRDFQCNIGDGVTAAVTELVLTPTALITDLVAEPGVAGVTFRWRSDDTPVAGENLFERDGVTALVQDSVGHAAHHYEGRVVTSMPSDGVDLALPSIMPGGTITLNWDPDGATPTTLNLVQVGTTLVATATSAQGTVATLDLVTGFLVVTFGGTEVPVLAGDGGNITLDFTPGTDVRSISDDGSGAIPDVGPILTAAGTIAYVGATAGAYAFTTDAGYEPGTGCPVLCDYDVQAWDVDPVSVGSWADDMLMEVIGNDDYYDVTTDTYSRFNINIRLLNSSTGLYDIVETYEEITFTDATSAQYFPDVLNDLSDLINVIEPALNAEGPIQLSGEARSQVVAAGDELVGNRAIAETLVTGGITPRTFSMSWTDNTSTTRTITDDGAGNLIGDVDGAGTNTIDYSTGAIDVLLSNAIAADTLVAATWRETPEESSHLDGFAGGADGTFTNATTYGRNQFTAITLEPNFKGLYALNKIEELMQVVIPDFAGDTQITKDLMDYVNGREVLPSGGDRFAILMVPQGSSAQEAVDFLRIDVAQNSKFAAMYWPWVKVADPLADNRPVVFPPLGHIAGVYARTDSTRNVGKAPAGTVDGALSFLVGLEIDQISQGERDIVYPARINPLVSGPQTGLAVWGARTTSLQSEWRYINARRLFMFVEKSVYNSTFWIVFENNGPGLWARIKAQLQSFLTNLFNDGLFAGTTPSQAFFVTVDESNNDQASIDAGQVIIDVGIAPNKPAEFVRFRFQQKTLDS